MKKIVRMKSNLIVVLLPLLMIFTVACADKKEALTGSESVAVSESISSSSENVQSDSVSESASQEAEVNEVTKEVVEPEEEIVEEIVEKPYPFKFVDVFGQEYETEIKVGFPKTEFKSECFSFVDGRTLYEDENYYSRQGIDVSNKQKVIDWKKVKEAGVEFAIIRLGYRGYGSYGDINIDLQFKRNMEEAAKQGIDIGVYFFAQAINENEAREEAEFVLKNLEGYELQLPVVYDPESILKDVARTDDVSGEQFTKNTIAFCEMVKDAGYEPMIYSNMLWEAFQFDMEKLTDYPFWYADYEQLPQTPYEFCMWQYSEKGRVDGIGNGVDLDIQFIRK